MELIIYSCFNCKKVFNKDFMDNQEKDCPFCYKENTVSIKKIERKERKRYFYKPTENPYLL